jgi:tRNA modification GTPase
LGGLVGYAGAQDDSSTASDGASRAPAAASDTDTIAAIVTGSAQGAVSIIRVSGKAAVPIAQQVFTPQSAAATRRRRAAAAQCTAADERAAWQPESHKVYYGSALDAEGAVLDEVLLLAMLAPRSYTSEDVVELHTHGGGVSAARVLQRCLEAGARLAQPGEFTLRAFLNGRLDLAQAESVAQVGRHSRGAAQPMCCALALTSGHWPHDAVCQRQLGCGSLPTPGLWLTRWLRLATYRDRARAWVWLLA